MVSSVTSAGRAGNWMAGPRVRVRRGRSAKLPVAAVNHDARIQSDYVALPINCWLGSSRKTEW